MGETSAAGYCGSTFTIRNGSILKKVRLCLFPLFHFFLLPFFFFLIDGHIYTYLTALVYSHCKCAKVKRENLAFLITKEVLLLSENKTQIPQHLGRVLCVAGQENLEEMLKSVHLLLYYSLKKKKIIADTMPSYVSRITQHFFELPCPYS